MNELTKEVSKKWLEEIGKHLVKEEIKYRRNVCPTCHLPLSGDEKMLQCSNCRTKIINFTFDGLGLS